MTERWTPEKRQKHSEMVRALHKDGRFRAKFYASLLRSHTPERRDSMREKMRARWADPAYREETVAKIAEGVARGKKRNQMPRELRPDEYDLYRDVKRKGRLSRSEAVAIVLQSRGDRKS
jgi:hypothetical protein